MSARSWLGVAIRIAAVSLALGLLLGLLSRLPGLPYNVRDMFWRGGNLLNLSLFGFFVVSLGAASALIALLLQRARLPALCMALGVVTVSALGYLLLTLSVTPETINDVIGTRVLLRAVERGASGGLAPFIVTSALHAPVLVQWLEGIVRYSALHAPLIIFTTLGIVAFSPGQGRRPGGARRYATVVLVAGALLWLCKLVVVDWAATDNLTELFADSGFFGHSGLIWLHAVIAIIGFDAALLWASLRAEWPFALALVVLALSMPIAWLLLGLGLEHELPFRGGTYSARQFLFGPDRVSTLSEGALFARWCVVHVLLVSVVAGGALLATPRRQEGDRAR